MRRKNYFLCAILLGLSLSIMAETKIVTSVSDLSAALANASYDVIELGSDISDVTDLTISRSLTLDLKGYTLTTTSPASGTPMVFTISGENVTFQSTGADHKGQIITRGQHIATLYITAGTTNVDNIAFEKTRRNANIYYAQGSEGGSVTNCAFSVEGNHSGGGIHCGSGSNKQVYITDCTANITYSDDQAEWSVACVQVANKTTAIVENCSFVSVAPCFAICNTGGYLTIKSGTYSSSLRGGNPHYTGVICLDGRTNAQANVTIEGGEFDGEMSMFAAGNQANNLMTVEVGTIFSDDPSEAPFTMTIHGVVRLTDEGKYIVEQDGPVTRSHAVSVHGAAHKCWSNGQLVIYKNGVHYNALGAQL